MYYGHHLQDKFLNEEVFKNKKDGIFVDIGAYDGIASSNVYFFEKNKNWDGIRVEPLPYIFPKLKKNRKCLCLNCCILDKKTKVSFLHVKPKKLFRIIEKEESSNGKEILCKSNIEKMSGIMNLSKK